MNTINFVTRTPVGAVTKGSVGGEGQGFLIDASGGNQVSLNLNESDVRSYDRAGGDLLVTLADGRVVVLEDYFSASSQGASHLYLSANGVLNEVTFVDTGSGALFAQYGGTETWGKWSPSDELMFYDDPDVVAGYGEDEVSMLAPALLGGAGLGGLGTTAALLGGGLLLGSVGGGSDGPGGGNGNDGGDTDTGDGDTDEGDTDTGDTDDTDTGDTDGGDTDTDDEDDTDVGVGVVDGGDEDGVDDDWIAPTIETEGPIVVGGTEDPVITITGTANPGSEIDVTVGGVTETVTADEDRIWEVIFDGEDFPEDGTYDDVVVEVTDPDETLTELPAPAIVIDLTPPDLAILEGTVSVGVIVNADDHADGVTVSGTSEPGATVQITINEFTETTMVGEDGVWVFTFDASVVAPGEYIQEISVTATDPFGNATVTTDQLDIDTVPHPLTIDPVTGDNLVNGAEAEAGFAITGTSTPGATVIITFAEHTYEAVVSSSGVWAIGISAEDVAGGEYSTGITATTVDRAGNTSSADSTVQIDTVNDLQITNLPLTGDDIINAEEFAGGITLMGTSQAGSTVMVSIAGLSQEATVETDGSWSVTFSGLDAGTYGTEATVTATDSAGNVETVSHPFRIDTEISVTLDGPVAGDNIVNATEAEGGFALTGTAEAGASVAVTFDGLSYTTMASEAGIWSVLVASADIRPGSYSTGIEVTATDLAGNASTVTGTLAVDTEISVGFTDTPLGGDDLINAQELADGLVLTGFADVGATVMVEVAGLSQEATVAADGTWSVTFAGLESGTYSTQAIVTATDAAGNSASATHGFDVDTDLAVTLDGPVAGDDLINGAEAGAGVALSGTADADATVSVSFDGTTYTTTASAAGVWAVTVPGADITPGTYDAAIDVTATDAAGNTASTSGTVAVDTETAITLSDAPLEGDNIVNAVERSDGIELTGNAEPGASVLVTLAGVTTAAVVDAAGNWTASFAATDLPEGETSAEVTAVSTDLAGNEATATRTVEIDTLVRNFAVTSAPGGADGILNAEEAANGLTLTGTTEEGASVSIDLDGVSHEATVDAAGNWTVTFAREELPTGEQTVTLTATSTDIAGNTEVLSQPVQIDTDAGLLTISPEPMEGDDIVNEVEASDGVTVTGTSNPGQAVDVTLGGVTHTVMTAADGTWSADFAPGEVPAGTYTSDITATISDAAGNTLTRTDAVNIDTEVVNFAISDTPIEGADDVLNMVEGSDGLILSGTTEPGATVEVSFEGRTVSAVVDAAGNWQAAFDAADIPEGQYTSTAEVVTVDHAGNVAMASREITVDSYVDRLETDGAPITPDNVINAAEAAEGFDLSGHVEVGSSVTVTIAGVSHAAQVSETGGWSVRIPGGAFAAATTSADILIEAVDAAGNTLDITETVSVDMIAPDTPDVASYTRDHTGLRGITLDTGEGDVSIGHVVQGSGGFEVDEVTFSSFEMPTLGETAFNFNAVVPDGSHLVVTATDDAGNVSGTYLVVDDTTTSEVAMTGQLATTLSEFNIETIDLQFAEESQLTITEAQLVALSSNSDTLTVEGGSDDSVTISGANNIGNDGEGYNLFQLGDATVRIDEDITNVVI